MALDYFLLVFIASFGVYQILSIHAGLKGLWLFRHQKIQYIFGVLVIIGAYGWFFITKRAAIQIQREVEGPQQLGLFLAAIVSSYIVTVIMSSIIQARGSRREKEPIKGKQHEQGIETLKTTTVLGGVISSLRNEREDKD